MAVDLNPAHVRRGGGGQDELLVGSLERNRLFLGLDGQLDDLLLGLRRSLDLSLVLERSLVLSYDLFLSLVLDDRELLNGGLGLGDLLLSARKQRQRGEDRDGHRDRDGSAGHRAGNASKVRIFRIHTNHSFFEIQSLQSNHRHTSKGCRCPAPSIR